MIKTKLNDNEDAPESVKKRTDMYTSGRSFGGRTINDEGTGYDSDWYEPNMVTEIEVPCTRLDTWIEQEKINNIKLTIFPANTPNTLSPELRFAEFKVPTNKRKLK